MSKFMIRYRVITILCLIVTLVMLPFQLIVDILTWLVLTPLQSVVFRLRVWRARG